MSGAFTPKTRALIKERDRCCIGCGATAPIELQHRRARGMGGSGDPATKSTANGIALCRSCHQWTEANPYSAAFLGWRVPQHADPTLIPVWRHVTEYGSHWALLNHTGDWTPADTHPEAVIAAEVIRTMLAARTAA